MSQSSMEELKAIVQRTLETKGVLGKIRAELRSSVFSAIQEEQADLNGESAVLRELKRSPEGRVALELVREFLAACGLDYTAAVLVPEANMAKEGERREELAAKLRVPLPAAGAHKAPLLVEMLRAHGRGDAPAPAPYAAASKSRPAAGAPASGLGPLRADAAAPKPRVALSESPLVLGSLPKRPPPPPPAAAAAAGATAAAAAAAEHDRPAGAPAPLGRLLERAAGAPARENADEPRREGGGFGYATAGAEALALVKAESFGSSDGSSASGGAESASGAGSPTGSAGAARKDKYAIGARFGGGLGGALGGGSSGGGGLCSGEGARASAACTPATSSSLLGSLPPLGAKRAGGALSSLAGLPPLGGSCGGAAAPSEGPAPAQPAGVGAGLGAEDDLSRLRAVEHKLRQMKESSPPPASKEAAPAAKPAAAPAPAPKPKPAEAPKPSALEELGGDDEISEEVYSLEADSYHSDGGSEQLDANSDKSGNGAAAWHKVASPRSRSAADQSMESSRLDLADGFDHVESPLPAGAAAW